MKQACTEEMMPGCRLFVQGMDGRVMDPAHPKERAYVIALGGELQAAQA
jgi:hypothetical protein